MAKETDQRTLRNDNGRVMLGLVDGQSLVVTRDGRPVGELVPLRRHRFVSGGAAGEVFRNAPRIDRHRSEQDLDAAADQDVEPVAERLARGLLDTSVLVGLDLLSADALPVERPVDTLGDASPTC